MTCLLPGCGAIRLMEPILEMERAKLLSGPFRAQAFKNEPLVKLQQLYFDRILDQLLFIAALFKPSLVLSLK